MKYNLFGIGLIAIVLSFGCIASRNVKDAPTAVYQHAQRETVLVIAPNGQGSAVIVKRRNTDGKTRIFAWTAAHVVEDFPMVKVRVTHRTEGRKAGNSTFDAKVLGKSEKTDCALIFIDAPEEFFEAALFSSDQPPAPGTPVFACGNFLGQSFDGSISTGVIAQIGVRPTDILNWPWDVVDQSTAPVYPGSSGGPVFDMQGRVLGLVVGGMNATLNVYVPVRALTTWAEEQDLLWAVRGSYCPSDARGEYFRPPVIKPKPSTPAGVPHSESDGCDQ